MHLLTKGITYMCWIILSYDNYAWSIHEVSYVESLANISYQLLLLTKLGNNVRLVRSSSDKHGHLNNILACYNFEIVN